ncbi:hypothetical protein M514_02771 [Trichuris suis]|uniref:GIY-YIG domain-containing protein n=1 Tax=Trichuris suis TaxID=68888 RepID=A0A085NH06_9BILA|nr:hypothetical protein M513_02771 [Trichuris suis]KFD68752.1 hypothetical protein M514_02771 [Trichuris suis]
MLKSDRAKVALDQRPGVVYEITSTCGALYMGETGNSLSHRFAEHLGSLTRYWNAEARRMRLDIRLEAAHILWNQQRWCKKHWKVQQSQIMQWSSRKPHRLSSLRRRELQHKRREIIEALCVRHNRTCVTRLEKHGYR